MHIHILGICGTFMGSLAVLAKQLGHTVSGSDANVYPPMSTQLEEQGISLQEGFKIEHLQPEPDLVVIGNSMSRGNVAVEYVLDKGLDYCSGPQWLAQWVLKDKWVLAVAGTHGKTTTSSMLAWILEFAGFQPGYLIGGVAKNFTSSATLGDSSFFVVEADEYDSAFFDKRSKFIHYSPRTLILNNLEFDHGDIFDDLAAIQRQFHHLVRIVPGSGLIISPSENQNLEQVLEQGCWSERQIFEVINPTEECDDVNDNAWTGRLLSSDGSQFSVSNRRGGSVAEEGEVKWNLTGAHNVNNAVAAVVAAHHVGITVEVACQALMQFEGVKRRQEIIAVVDDITIYDDFAHHPTAIAATLEGLSAKIGSSKNKNRLIAVIEPRSNTMKTGIHQDVLARAFDCADLTLWFQPFATGLDIGKIAEESANPAFEFKDIDDLVCSLVAECRAGDHVVIMSNGGFGGIHQKIIDSLQESRVG